MRNPLQAGLTLAGGLRTGTHRRVQTTAGHLRGLAGEVADQSRSQREAVAALVKFEVDRVLVRVGLASADEVSELSARVRALEATVQDVPARVPADQPAAPDA